MNRLDLLFWSGKTGSRDPTPSFMERDPRNPLCDVAGMRMVGKVTQRQAGLGTTRNRTRASVCTLLGQQGRGRFRISPARENIFNITPWNTAVLNVTCLNPPREHVSRLAISMWHHDPCRTKTPLQPLGGRVAPRTFKLPLTAVHDNLSNVSRQSIARPFLQRISSSAPCFATEDAAQGAQKSALPTQHCQTVSVPAPPADPTHKNQWGSFRLFQLLWVSEIVVMTFAPEVKATRAAPAPVNQKKHPHKHRHSSSSPFDPEELSRKLTIIQAEQRVLAEQTRIARIETEHKATTQRSKERRVEKKHYDLAHEFPQPDKKKSLPAHVGVKSTPDQCQDESALDNTGVGFDASCMNHAPGVRNGDDGCSPTYRHIPQVAALQFARTTTIDPPGEKGLVHRLSKMALKYHMDGVNADTGFQDESHTIAPYEAAKTLKKAQRKREKQYQRNQFQHPSTLLPTVGINDNVIHPVQPTLFETDSSPKSLDSDDEEGAAGMTMEKVASAPHAEKHESPHHEGLTEAEIAEHRVDWTQSDEIKLRKSESRWRLKRHLGGHKHRDYPAILPEEKEPTMEDVTKSRIAALLPRLRRHSAGDLL